MQPCPGAAARHSLPVRYRWFCGPSAMTSKWPRSAPGALRTFDLEIDPEQEQVKRAGRIITLSRREYELLLLLMLHRGRIVTRNKILTHFYNDDPDAAGQSNLVEV